MKRVITFVVCTLVVAAVVHVGTLHALPSLIMHRVMSKAGGDGATNAFKNPPLPTDKARGVVRPSPDLAYSVCVMDLSKGPIGITVPLTAPYTSVALYATNTDNYFVRNDRDTGGKTLALVVVGPKAHKPDNLPAGTELVEAPSMKGLVLVRRVVEKAEDLPAIDAMRAASVCAPIADAPHATTTQ